MIPDRPGRKEVYEPKIGKSIEPGIGDTRGGASADGQPECGI